MSHKLLGGPWWGWWREHNDHRPRHFLGAAAQAVADARAAAARVEAARAAAAEAEREAKAAAIAEKKLRKAKVTCAPSIRVDGDGDSNGSVGVG